MERWEQLCSDQPEVGITERSLFIHCDRTTAFHGRNSNREGSVSNSWQLPATSFPVISNNILIKRESLGGPVEGQASIIWRDPWWSAESVTPWTATAGDTTAYLRPVQTDPAADSAESTRAPAPDAPSTAMKYSGGRVCFPQSGRISS